MSRSFKYTEEELLRASELYINGVENKDIAQILSNEFGTERTEQSVDYCVTLLFKKDIIGKRRG